MMRQFFAIAATGLLLAGIAAGQSKNVPCNRQCLEGFVNQYLEAMVARDVSKAQFAENARFTENAKEINLAKPTEGLWASSTTLVNYKFSIADPQAGQVAFVGLVKEAGKPALLSLRLRIENQRITEIESVVVRNMNEANLWTLKTPPAEFTRALAPEERVSREELVRISNAYFNSIEQSNGKLVPWHDECYRLENGMWTAGPKLPAEIAANQPKAPAQQPGAKVSSICPRGVHRGDRLRRFCADREHPAAAYTGG
jgi:hypothetical protein